MTDLENLLRGVVVANQQPTQKDAVAKVVKVLEELIVRVKSLEER